MPFHSLGDKRERETERSSVVILFFPVPTFTIVLDLMIANVTVVTFADY